ncbi:MAG: glycosyltransferase family 39 protein [Acidobacteriota bacterium]
MQKAWQGILWTLLGLALVCAMPSDQSLWLDEGYTAPYAQEGDFRSFVDRITADPGSEALRPLGMVSFWLGAKVFGSSEIGLRRVSALWVAVAVILLWRCGQLLGYPWLPALLAVHPFVWYYATDARPYTMLIAMGAGVLYALLAILAGEATTDRGLSILVLFGLLLSATDVLGVLLFAAAVAVVAAVLVGRGWRPRRRHLAAFVVAGVALALLGAYYVATLSRGVETGWEGVWRVSASNLLFAAYEHLGFAGFGPGRYELRQAVLGGDLEGVLQTFARPSAIGLPILAGLYLAMLRRLARRLRAGREGASSQLLGAGAVILLTTAAIFAVSWAARFSFWGRHLAPLCVFVVLVAVVAAHDPSKRGRSLSPLTLALALAWLASSLLLRWHDSHRRDDYRAASGIALAAAENGETVWWVASRLCGEYYGLRFCDPFPVPERGLAAIQAASDRPRQRGRCVVPLESPEAEDLAGLPQADLIVISRPEFYDHRGAIRTHLTTHAFTTVDQPTAFQVLRTPAP